MFSSVETRSKSNERLNGVTENSYGCKNDENDDWQKAKSWKISRRPRVHEWHQLHEWHQRNKEQDGNSADSEAVDNGKRENSRLEQIKANRALGNLG